VKAALAAAGYPAKADPAINKPLVIAILTYLVLLVTMVYGPIAALLVELFPTRIRYTAMSLPYHIGNGWFGGFLPTTAFAMVAATGDIYYGLWYPVVAGLTLVVGLMFLYRGSLRRVPRLDPGARHLPVAQGQADTAWWQASRAAVPAWFPGGTKPSSADPVPPCAELAADDPLYILYTSGTTGTPKGVVRENGGHAVALAWSMANIYGIGAGDPFWAASDVGWVVGHSYIVYGPLLVGATTVLFEGKPIGTPDPGTFWRVMNRHGVKSFFTAPTAIRAVRKEDPDAAFLKDIGTGDCRVIFLAGERADPDTIGWLEEQSGLPVIDHWWQTELGWPGVASCFALGDLRRKRGSAGFPVPGYEFAILGEDGQPLPQGQSGAVAIKEPLAPGAFRSLWNNPAGFAKNFATFPGWYETGDAGHFDDEGFLHIMGRTDDIINVAGHRLSTGQMEQIVASQDGVAECAVIGADDAIKGMIPVAFVVARAGVNDAAALHDAVIAAVRAELGAVAALKTAYVVPQLPKTRSGKILRNLLRKIVNGESFDTPPTIEDPSVPDLLVAAVKG
jgi:propionyl-CoA synthetase